MIPDSDMHNLGHHVPSRAGAAKSIILRGSEKLQGYPQA